MISKSAASGAKRRLHNGPSHPSPWVTRFAGLVPEGGRVLDVACGSGRHARLFIGRGHPVTMVDVDISRVADLATETRTETRTEIIEADIENGAPWPFAGREFAGIVVTNYLYRPLFPTLTASLAHGGVLIYETFAQGNERFGKPRNPDHLLRPGELLDAVRGTLQVVAYEFGTVREPRPAALGRLCAVKPANADAAPYPLDLSET